MISSLTLTDSAGVEVEFLDGPVLRVSNVIGLPGLGFAGPRDSVTSRPSYHGSSTRSRWLQAGLVTVEGIVVGADAGGARQALDTLKRALYDAVAAPRLLAWTYEDGLMLQARARLVDGVDVALEALGRIMRYQASFRLDDPRGYSQTQQIVNGNVLSESTGGKLFPYLFPYLYAGAATGGQVAVTNNGTVPSPPVIRLLGACQNPRIRLVTTGEQIVLAGTVAQGEFIELDIAGRTVTRNGTTSAQGMVDAASTTWFEIPPGTHALQMFALTFDTASRPVVHLRDAYI